MFNDGIKLQGMTLDASLYTEGCTPGYIFLFDMHGVRLGHLTRLSPGRNANPTPWDPCTEYCLVHGQDSFPHQAFHEEGAVRNGTKIYEKIYTSPKTKQY